MENSYNNCIIFELLNILSAEIMPQWQLTSINITGNV